MVKCKVCGQFFDYHVSNAHLETHDITRQEYNKIQKAEYNFTYGGKPYSEQQEDIEGYSIASVHKSIKRRNK